MLSEVTLKREDADFHLGAPKRSLTRRSSLSHQPRSANLTSSVLSSNPGMAEPRPKLTFATI